MIFKIALVAGVMLWAVYELYTTDRDLKRMRAEREAREQAERASAAETPPAEDTREDERRIAS